MEECIIIDTKWKTIDSTRPDKHYLLDVKDMYQLYVYGQKYRHGESIARGVDVIPKLILLYPYTEHFTEKMPPFIYDDIFDGLKVLAIPFNLVDVSTYKDQVEMILKLARA